MYVSNLCNVHFKLKSVGAYELAKAVEELGAGEILPNCIDCDGAYYIQKFLSLMPHCFRC